MEKRSKVQCAKKSAQKIAEANFAKGRRAQVRAARARLRYSNPEFDNPLL
jgi:hypothetical protein